MKRSIFTLVVVMLTCVLHSKAQVPKIYTNFDNINISDAKPGKGLLSVPGISGKSIQQDPAQRVRLNTNVFSKGKIKKAFTFEFWHCGDQFYFACVGKQYIRIQLAQEEILFNTTVRSKGKEVQDSWKIPLQYAAPFSYAGISDGKWHHFVFQLDVNTGIKRVWIDGKLTSFSDRKIASADEIITGNADGFGQFDKVDEIAIYDVLLSQSDIVGHYNSKSSYGNRSEARVTAVSAAVSYFQAKLDPKEFAPGYPNYNVQAIDQLKSFPDPRFSASKKMPRNFSWMDISYLHRELPGIGGKGHGKANPEKAVAMVDELVSKWNYYLEIPCLRVDSMTAANRYGKKGNIEYAIIQYARAHPDIPTSSVLMQIQGKPFHARYDRKTPFATAQDLPVKYYMQDANGKPVVYQNKRWISPLAPLDIIRFDGLTTVFYLRQLQKFLGKPIDFLNDNGEIFGHMRPEALLKQDPTVWADYKKSGLSIPAYSAKFQSSMDVLYRNTILDGLGWKKTQFTFYNVSAYNASYWPAYSGRRKTNLVGSGDFHYSTPSFYPARPNNWRSSSGPLNGYGTVANGRRTEIQLGDHLFAPFVSAGWNLEENNIRPAQWLGLLKAMTMLGAEFFHVGYFNVTGKTGWPNGAGPNDPRGYVYQAAMPAYAQAVISNIYDDWRKSVLLNPQPNLNPDVYSFRMKASKENHLVIARKLGAKYIIFGTVQPSSNYQNSAPVEESTSISLEGKTIRFKIRRQGSMYMLDLSSPSKPIFYQLDGWHEYEHPYYWSKNIKIEAELGYLNNPKGQLITERSGNSEGDFNAFTTYVRLNQSQLLNIDIPGKTGSKYGCKLSLRNVNGKNALVVLKSGKGSIQKNINAGKWTQLTLNQEEINQLFGLQPKTLSISVAGGGVDIDWAEF
jgi:hypothetical protein